MANSENAERIFDYTPTEPGRHTRLVTIYPGISEEIKCSLAPCSLENDKPEFVALSYVWGDPNLVEAITCDNATLFVTKNLKIAMRFLRHWTEKKVYWIDAICINQNDLEERNRHVQSMREIYSAAREVLVWLGPENADSFKAFELIDMLAKSWRQDEIVFPSMDDDDGRPFWDAFTTFCQRSWFRRVWVRQEVTVARKVVLKCGDQTTEWDNLVDVFREIGALRLNRYEERLRPLEPGFGIINLRLRFQSEHGVKYHDLLDGQYLESSDPRDKVYALIGLGMAAAGEAVEFDIDYSKSISDVFRDLVRFLIAKFKTVQVLGHVRKGSENDPRIKDLPSWVPDLTFPAPGPVLYQPGSRYEDFCAAGVSDATFRDVHDDPQAIALKGYMVDTVTAIGSTLSSPPTLFSEDEEKCIILENWENIAAEQAPYITGESIIDVYTWTLVADANMPEDGPYMYGCWASSVIGAEPMSYRDLEPDHSKPGSYHNELAEALQQACETVKAHPDAVRLRDQGARETNQDWGAYSARYLVGMMDAAFDRRLFATEKKYIGLAPPGAREGDMVCVLLGGNTPFLLRPSEEYQGRYSLVGECYVHGIMHGELLKENLLEVQEFILR